MSWIWAVPPAVAVVGLGVGMALAREMARAAHSLHQEVAQAGALRQALSDLRTALRLLTRPEPR